MAWNRENYYILATESTIKLTYVKSVPDKGVSSSNRNSENSKRFDNIRRARTEFLNLGQSNTWQYMATFTSASENPSNDIRSVMRWLKNWNTHHHASIQYLLVFELGDLRRRIHCHALLRDVPDSFVRTYTSAEYSALPPDLKRLYSEFKVDGGTRLATCPWWRFGWSTLVPLDGSPKVVSYMTKYLTKSNISFTTKFGGHAFFASKGLNRVKKQKVPVDIAATMWHRVPPGSWYSSFRADDGTLLSSCFILDRDKISSSLWDYYIGIFRGLQLGG